MNTLGFGKTTRDTIYSNTSDTEIQVNIFICNTHSSAVDCNIAFSSSNGVSKSVGMPIYNKSMSAGETKEFLNLTVNSKQLIMALAGTADKVSIKVHLHKVYVGIAIHLK